MSDVNDTLVERGKRYGDFADVARIANSLQDVLESEQPKWRELPHVVRRGLTTICDKIARIMSGDPYYVDNYHDISGYAKLMEDFVSEENVHLTNSGADLHNEKRLFEEAQIAREIEATACTKPVISEHPTKPVISEPPTKPVISEHPTKPVISELDAETKRILDEWLVPPKRSKDWHWRSYSVPKKNPFIC